jgi:hypothetical protein
MVQEARVSPISQFCLVMMSAVFMRGNWKVRRLCWLVWHCIVTYRPVARQTPRNKQQENSRSYAMIVRWAVTLDPFLGNDSVNTFPRQRIRIQWGKWGVAYAVRA